MVDRLDLAMARDEVARLVRRVAGYGGGSMPYSPMQA